MCLCHLHLKVCMVYTPTPALHRFKDPDAAGEEEPLDDSPAWLAGM